MAEISTFRTYVEEVPDHECGLDIRNVVEEALYGGMYPTRSQRFKKTFQRWCLVSRKHPYTNRFFKSTASIGREIIRHAKCCPTIIHPFSVFRSNWEIFMMVIHTAAFFIFPFILSFPNTASGEYHYIDPATGLQVDYDSLDEEEIAQKRKEVYMQLVNWDYVLMGFGIITIIDMGINFSTGYVRNDTREIVLKRKYICRSWTSLKRAKGNISYESLWRASVFRTVKIICTVPNNEHTDFYADQDVAINLLTNIAGMILLFYLAAQIVISTRTANSAKARYEELQVQLSEYVKYKQVPLELEKRLVEFYRYCFRQNFYREPAILEFLSGQLRQEVLLHSCRRLVEIVPFFFNVPPNLMIRVVTCLVREVVLTNDVVMTAGVPGDSMYFISSGSVAVYTSAGSEVCHLKEGAHFGEIALVIEEETRTASVVAVETSELYSLSRQDFLYAVAPDPELLARIRRTALKRLWHIGAADHARRRRSRSKRSMKIPAWQATPSFSNPDIQKGRHRSAEAASKIKRLGSVMVSNPPQNAEENTTRWHSREGISKQ